MNKPKRILICPLDWGLGHATRCIPIIRSLLENGAEVIIAADKRPLELLKKEFPHLGFVKFAGYDIRYPSKGSMTLTMLLSIPKIVKRIRTERIELEKLIDDHEIDIVISDNRYGCWGKKTKNIFITHQLMVKSPFGEYFLHKIIERFIKNYDECWVPDNEKNNTLSGDLSHKHTIKSNTYFVGPLSRFNSTVYKQENNYDLMAIVSGPEPQRTIFERIITEQLFKSGLKTLVVLGLPELSKKIETKGNLTMINHLPSKEMEAMICSSNIIISRSGYSTIMDLSVLKKKVIFIPTPGQTEQEYLAEELYKKKIAYYQKQKEFKLEEAIQKSKEFTGFERSEISKLNERIAIILS